MPTLPRHSIALCVSALALLAAPIALNQSALSDIAAYADKGNGNGGGGGNSGGNGNGNSGGNGSGGGGSGEHGGSGSQSVELGGGSDAGRPGHSNKGASQRKSGQVEVQAASATELLPAKERNLHAELAGLNSLKRNINGLMNSADPRMDGIREFIMASAELEGALAELGDANDAFNDAKLAYLGFVSELGVGDYDDVSPAGLLGRIEEIDGLLEDPDLTEEDIAALEEERDLLEDAVTTINDSEELANLLGTLGAVGDAEDKVAGLEGATDEDALKDALRTAANENREVTDEVVAWASKQLGVGDDDGLIDDYLASQ